MAGRPALATLTKRADFLAASRAARAGTPGFLLQARKRPVTDPTTDPTTEADPTLVRVGFTCSRKVGNAVARNRAKRRLREVARAVLPQAGRPGWDYVLVGRAGATAERPFELLLDDLRRAVDQVHSPKARRP